MLNSITVSTVQSDAIVTGAKDFAYDLCLTAVESGIIVRRWYEAGGKARLQNTAYGVLAAALMTAMFLACAACYAVYAAKELAIKAEATWVMYGTLDGEGPCVGGSVDCPAKVETEHKDVNVHVFTAWAFDKWGRKTDFDAAETMAWAEGLIKA